jgi:hypothetical protein
MSSFRDADLLVLGFGMKPDGAWVHRTGYALPAGPGGPKGVAELVEELLQFRWKQGLERGIALQSSAMRAAMTALEDPQILARVDAAVRAHLELPSEEIKS